MRQKSQRTVLITGGSSGIGFEMASQLNEQKDRVIICGRSQAKLEEAQKRVTGLQIFQCDVTIKEDREALFQFVSEKFNTIDMLVNNAGMAERYLFDKVKNLEEKLNREWQVNYFAPVLLTKQFLPLLIKNKGSIVNVTSGLVHAPLSIEPNYCATKAALHSMTQSMRVQLSKLGVKVQEIFYPAVDTPFQGGHAPKFAIEPDEAALIAIKGLNRGKNEIHVKMARALWLISRLMPEKAVRLINRVVPDNIEEILVGD